MFVLGVISGPTKGQAIKLVFGGSLTIGSGWNANVHLKDSSVDPLHAEINWDDEGFSLLDLSEGGRTFVNGMRIDSRVGLRLGDRIQLGRVILQLKQATAVETQSLEDPFSDVPTDGVGMKLLGAGDGGVPVERALVLRGDDKISPIDSAKIADGYLSGGGNRL